MAKYRDWVRELSSEQLVAIFEIGLKIRESTTVTVDVSESYLKNELSAAMKPVQPSLQTIENKIQSELSKKLGELSTSLKVSPYVRGIVGENEVMKLLEGAMSSPGHEIQSFFTSYLVPHFSEVWKCGIVRQSKDIVALFPQS